MKVFDKDEQKIIGKITHGSGYSRNLINIFDSLNNLNGIRVQIDKVYKKANFLFQIQGEEPTNSEISWGIEKQKQLVELLIKHLTLLRYLEKEELAIFFEVAKSNEQTIEFGMGAANMSSYSIPIEDQNIVDLLIKYVHKEIMPSPSLRELENNGFKSDEEIRFNKQYVVTWIAIAVSLFLGLYGIYNNQQNSISQESQFVKQTEENQESEQEISEKLKLLSISIDDNSSAIAKVSEALSKLTEKVDLIYRHKSFQIKLSKEAGKKMK